MQESHTCVQSHVGQVGLTTWRQGGGPECPSRWLGWGRAVEPVSWHQVSTGTLSVSAVDSLQAVLRCSHTDTAQSRSSWDLAEHEPGGHAGRFVILWAGVPIPGPGGGVGGLLSAISLPGQLDPRLLG